MPVRKIVKFDEDLCDGCGDCVPSCAEGAIQIIDGKARLVRDDFCDGLGVCLGDCPQGAITIEEREASDFDEEAVKQHLARQQPEGKAPSSPLPDHAHPHPHAHAPGPGAGFACPSARAMKLRPGAPSPSPADGSPATVSALAHWPVKLQLVPPQAPFLRGTDLLLLADCVPVAFANLHGEILPGHTVVIGCPKFDDYEAAKTRLADILGQSGVKSLTVAHVEVPCCFGYWQMAQEAMAASGRDLPLRQIVLGVRGEIKDEPSPFAALGS